MLWEVAGYSEKWLRISAHPDSIIIDEYERGESVHGARLRCYVECDNEIQAETAAIDAFDTFLKGLVLASGIAYDIAMDRPRQVTVPAEDGKRILRYDPQRKYTDSFLVEPFRAYGLPPFSTDELYEWIDLIQRHKENAMLQRLVALFCRAVRLGSISESAGYLDFIKIIEFFIEKKYRKELESRATERVAVEQMASFSVDFGKLVRKYFPEFSKAKRDKIAKDVALKCFSQVPYTNRDLLDYVCRESGFYEKTLGRRRAGLDGVIDIAYGHWPEEERKKHSEELYREHEKHILEISRTLLRVRGLQAHISEQIQVDRGTFEICGAVAHHLLSELIKGNIILDGETV